MTQFSIQLSDTDSEISKAIMDSLRSYLSGVFNRIPSKISTTIKDIVRESLRAEPEYISLKNGKLKSEMGIPNSSDIDTVIELLVNTIEIQNIPISYSSRSLSGGFRLTMIKSDDLGGVISASAAYVNDSQRGYSLPWLEWLTLRGNEIIVYNYDVKIGPNPRSRTGNAIMVQSNRNWRVPTEFVGTITNNWTTRAIKAAEPFIITAIEQALKDSL